MRTSSNSGLSLMRKMKLKLKGIDGRNNIAEHFVIETTVLWLLDNFAPYNSYETLQEKIGNPR
jgi:hypothetical protein